MMMRASFVTLWAVAVTLAGAGRAETGTLLGHLTTHAAVSVESADGSTPVTDSTHPYAAGERIVTGEGGEAVLTIPGGSLALEPMSRASVTHQADTYRVRLEAGVMRLRSDPSVSVLVDAAGLVIEPAPVDAEAEPAVLDVAIGIDADGRVVVENRGRSLRVMHLGPDQSQRTIVAANQTWAFHPVERDVAADADDPPGMLPQWVPRAGAFLGTAGAATSMRLLDDDDDDERRASQVR